MFVLKAIICVLLVMFIMILLQGIVNDTRNKTNAVGNMFISVVLGISIYLILI